MKKINKKYLVLAILLLVTFILGFYLRTINNTVTDKIEIDFSNDLVDISKIDSFKWDAIGILTPYSIVSKFENSNELDFSKLKGSEINKIRKSNSISEGEHFIIFLNNGVGVKYSQVPRKNYDFSNLKESILIPRNNAVFMRLTDTNVFKLNR